MSQQSTPLSPIVHSESSLTPVEEKKKQKLHSQGRVEAARSQLRIGISASQGQDMEYLNSAHTLNMLGWGEVHVLDYPVLKTPWGQKEVGPHPVSGSFWMKCMNDIILI